MPAAARILDANINRAREALRVMEDAARFALNDAALCESLKKMRHELRDVVDQLVPAGTLEASRDTPGDVGAEIATASEMSRGNLLEVIIAAGKRLTESLRVIEEIAKIPSSPPNAAGHLKERVPALDAASRIETLRYCAYEIDAQLQLRFGSGRAAQWKVCVLLTKMLCKRPWQDVLREVIGGGADCIQVREKGMPGGELLRHVREVQAIVCDAGHAKRLMASSAFDGRSRPTVIVNDRADIAMAAGADGVHVGQHDLAVHDVRRLAGRSLIVGVSTHDLQEAAAAVEAGADYCGVGSMFESGIRPGQRPSGAGYLREFVKRYPHMPHLAIGGIDVGNIHHLVEAGVRGVAVSSAVCAADEPSETVRQLRIAIGSQRSPMTHAGVHV